MSHPRALLLAETTASLAWLGMDACWMFGAATPALGLAGLTVALSVAVLCLVPPTWTSRLVSGAMTAWVGMNVLWMAHDLGLVRDGLMAARVLFVMGALMFAFATLLGRRTAVTALAARVRRGA